MIELSRISVDANVDGPDDTILLTCYFDTLQGEVYRRTVVPKGAAPSYVVQAFDALALELGALE